MDGNRILDFLLRRKIAPEPASVSWSEAVELGWMQLSSFLHSPSSGVCSCACGIVGEEGNAGPSKRAID